MVNGHRLTDSMAAVDAVHARAFGQMVALQGGAIVRVPISEAVGHLKRVEPDLLRTAGIFQPHLHPPVSEG